MQSSTEEALRSALPLHRPLHKHRGKHRGTQNRRSKPSQLNPKAATSILDFYFKKKLHFHFCGAAAL
jgi:hypothetical protein